jgi:transcriptional regulator with XRE-family HTH domain
MHFAELQQQLLATLRTRLQNGEITERRLALLTGISQPHVHNVLKGERILSISATDRILARLHITVLDLLEPGDSDCHIRAGYGGGYVEVPVLDGWLGPGLPLPIKPSRVHHYPFLAHFLTSVEQPVLARLAADPKMDTLFRENDLILLDQSPVRRAQLRHNTTYVVNRSGEGVVRSLHQERDDLLILGSHGRRQADGCEILSLEGVHLLDVVRARVAWIGRFLDTP